MHRLIFAPALAALALAAGCNKPATPPAAAAGIDVTEVRYSALSDAVSEQKGKVVLVDFWATWCGPCVKKFPHFVATHKKYKDRGLTCMSISLDPEGPKKEYDKGKVLKYLQEQDAAFPNFILLGYKEDDVQVGKRFGLEGGIPFQALFDKAGAKVWDSEQTRLSDEELDKLIEAELAK